MPKPNYKAITIVLGLVVMSFFFAWYILAWSEPSQAPPGCTPGAPGCDAPINVGPTPQTKTGLLGIDVPFPGNDVLDLKTAGASGWVGIVGNRDWFTLWSTSAGAFGDLHIRNLLIDGGGISTFPASFSVSQGTIEASKFCLGDGEIDCIDDWSSAGTSLWTLFGSNLYPNNTGWNVGIGTTSPANPLHISSDGAKIRLTDTASGQEQQINFASGGGRFYFAPYDDAAWQWGREFGYDPGANMWYAENGFTVNPGNLTVAGGISTYDATVSDNTIETGKLCLGNAEVACITAWDQAGGAGLWTDEAGYIWPNNVNNSWQIQDDGDLQITDDADIYGLDVLQGFNDLRLYGNSAKTATIWLDSPVTATQNLSLSSDYKGIYWYDGGAAKYLLRTCGSAGNLSLCLRNVSGGDTGLLGISPTGNLTVTGDITAQSGIVLGGVRKTAWPSEVNLQGWSFADDYFYDDGEQVIRATDEWLRLNPAGHFASGIYTPGLLRADGGLRVSDDEGFWRHDEDVVRTGDSFIVDGNVGIGDSSPDAKLDVEGNARFDYSGGYTTINDTSGVQVYNAEGSSGEVRLGAAWSRPGVYSSTNLNLLGASGLALSGRGNATDLYIDSSGNVGIGTTSPVTAKLRVFNDSETYAILGENTAPSSGTVVGVAGKALGTALINVGLYGESSGASYNWGLYVAAGESHIIDKAHFYSDVLVDGNLGIGTTNPGAYKLNVAGNLWVNNIPQGTSTNLLCSSDTNSGEIQGCSAAVIGGPLTWKHYFLTDTTYNGNLTVLGGGDALCNIDANAIPGKSYHFASTPSPGYWDESISQINTVFYYNKHYGNSGSPYTDSVAGFWINFTGANNCLSGGLIWNTNSILVLGQSGHFKGFLDTSPTGKVGKIIAPLPGSPCSVSLPLLCIEN